MGDGRYGRCFFPPKSGSRTRTADESRIVKREKVEKRRAQRIETSKARRANELMSKPHVNPSLKRLLYGDPIALEEQRLRNEQIRMSQ